MKRMFTRFMPPNEGKFLRTDGSITRRLAKRASERAIFISTQVAVPAVGRQVGGAGMVGFQTSKMVLRRCEKTVASPIPVFKD